MGNPKDKKVHSKAYLPVPTSIDICSVSVSAVSATCLSRDG